MDSQSGPSQGSQRATRDAAGQDPTDRRPDWVIFQERDQREQAEADEVQARDERERSDERSDHHTWAVADDDSDDDVDC